MKNIVLEYNKLVDVIDEEVEIINNKIIFKESGDYILEYVNSSDINLEVEVNDNVLVKLFVFCKSGNINVYNHFILNERSNLIYFQFYEVDSVCEKRIVDLNGKYAKYYEGFSSISRGIEDYYKVINHNNCYVTSDIINKCVGIDGSKINLVIDSILMMGNIDCVMNQESRILTLGDVDARVVPNMFIDENSVEAKHGSVIGTFDFLELFYLMSRGINREEAILLLIKGFLFSNLVIDISKREIIMNSILKLREVIVNE